MYCFNIQAADCKNELERATTQQSQYERLLDEYSNFLETGQDKLWSETVTARDLPQLQDQLAKHKVDQGNFALQKKFEVMWCYNVWELQFKAGRI